MNLDEIQDLVERAKQRGMNPIERLNALGLILTDERHVQLVREAAALLADRIERDPLAISAAVLKRGLAPLDVKQAIVKYIRKNFTENHVK